ncbi:MAG TPA: hypothetical protein DCM40_44665 [Maribacter sp.]|nr:hypothetical protein [Maribacter sp.]|tara:strand:- start:2250 stop:2594 length:345 start_codon:yes stop_codon:yes gene_type:complete
MSEESQKIYTFSVEAVYEMLDSAQDDRDVARELLAMYLDLESQNEYISFLLSEVFWTNYSITKLIEKEIDTAVLTEDKQFIVTETTLNILQSLVISKHAASSELRKMSVSLQEN